MRIRKSLLSSFLVRTLIAIVVVGSIYGVYYLLQDRTTKVTPAGATKASVRVKLSEHALSITSFKIIDTSDPAVGYKLESLRSSIDSTKTAYTTEVDAYQKLNPNDKTDFKLFIGLENDLLKIYDTRYNELKKIIVYRPLTDLGGLEPAKDKDEIISRINSTLGALDNITKTNTTISVETKSAIAQASSCLSNLSQNVNEQKNDSYKSTVEQCDRTYSSVRINTAKDVTKYLNPPATNDLINVIRNLTNKLG